MVNLLVTVALAVCVSVPVRVTSARVRLNSRAKGKWGLVVTRQHR